MEHKNEDPLHLLRFVGLSREWDNELIVSTNAIRDLKKKDNKALFFTQQAKDKIIFP